MAPDDDDRMRYDRMQYDRMQYDRMTNRRSQDLPPPTGPGLGLGIAAIALCVALGYANVLDAPFVFDDLPGIVRNDDLRIESLEPAGLYAAAVSQPSPRRPVSNLSLALNHYAGGLDVRGYHVVNLVVHGVCGLLVYLLALAILRDAGRQDGQGFPLVAPSRTRLAALFAALLFVSHPVQTQAVTYVIQRMASLAALFCLAALLCWVHARQTSDPRRRRLLLGGALAAWLLALGSKENAATLPLLVGLYELCFVLDLRSGVPRRTGWALAAGLVAGVAIVFAFTDGNPSERLFAIYEHRDFTPTERVLTQLRVVPFYASLVLVPLPSRLNLLHGFQTSHGLLDPPTTALAGLALLALVAIAILVARRHRLVAFCVFWFLLALSLESSIVGLEMVYEHRLYLPMFGCCLLASATLMHAVGSRPRVALALCAAIVASLVLTTRARNETWRDELVFWGDVVAKNPESHRGHLNLGLVHKARGERESMLFHYREAVRLKPDYEVAHNNLGNAWLEAGRPDRALEHFDAALRSRPDYRVALYNSGRALAQAGRMEQAVARLRGVLALEPDHADAWYALGVVLSHGNRFSEAGQALAEAVRLDPNQAPARYDLGIALARQGRFDAAIAQLEAALRLRTPYPEAEEALATCRRMQTASPE